MTQTQVVIRDLTAIADPNNSTNAIPNTMKVNSDGSINTAGTTVITPVKSTVLTPTQVTVPATTNGILVLAANANRLGATISNPSSVTVYIGSAATGLTVSNGFGIPAGSSYNIDEPLYTGAIYGIIATGTQVVTVVELT